MAMKRSVGEAEFDSIWSNANFSSRVFECKTWNKQFPYFQALGGHRSSHKKPKISATTGDGGNESSMRQSALRKPKMHECSVCGLEFSIGQALGGHMRNHRANAIEERRVDQASLQVPAVTKSSSSRVLWLDLNLTPTENDLKIEMIKPTPSIFCYL